MPAVSVVIPTHNRADLLAQTLESVRRQTLTDFECIVVDDGSTDETPEVLRDFTERDHRMIGIRQENAGVCRARDRGIAAARAPLIALSDSDDLLAPDKLEWQAAELTADPDAVMVYGDTFNFRGDDPTVGAIYQAHVQHKPSGPPDRAFRMLLTNSAIYAPMVRAEALRRAGPFDASLRHGEDWDMWIRVSRLGSVIYRPRIALHYRVHESNRSTQDVARHYRAARSIFRKHVGSLPRPERPAARAEMRAYFRRGYERRIREQAHRLSLAGDWAAARTAWRTLLELNPALAAERDVLPNALWALLPTSRAPVWRREPATSLPAEGTPA